MSLTLADFGSYYAGGTLAEVDGEPMRKLVVTRDISLDFNPNGTFAVEQAYVQYFIPAARNDKAPVVLQHGGGLNGSCWETTPDGRPGWISNLLHRGFEVHVVDNVERGRAGWMPDRWQGQPVMRSMQDAWTLFRFGLAQDFDSRKPFPEQQFPIDYLETFARSFCPRWTSTSALQVAALIAVLEHTGPAVVISHSQGGEIAFDAAVSRPELFSSIIALEPSVAPFNVQPIANIPTILVHGDYLDKISISRSQRKQWLEIVESLNSHGGGAEILDLSSAVTAGTSHMMMMDKCSDLNLQTILDRIFSL